MEVRQFDPYIREEEIASVVDSLKSNWVTEGPKTRKMEEMLQEITGARHAILVPNGTLALFVALKCAGIGPGDEVIVPTFTFIASATSIVFAGGTPVMCDVREEDLNLDPEDVRRKLSDRTKAILPVHIYGQSADMDAVMQIARERNLLVIEDAAQGIGTTCGAQHVGTFGTAGCLSFFADKTVTTAEGGAILSNDDGYAESVRYFKNQGRLTSGSFLHERIGYNFRITDLQAALGIVQLSRLDWIIARKLEIESAYRERLADLPVEFLPPSRRGKRVPFRINIFVDDAEALAGFLSNHGVGVRRVFYPMHRQPCFTPENARIEGEFPVAERAFARGISLPSGVALTEGEIDYVCETIRRFFEAAS